jgi:hypothetical protein
MTLKANSDIRLGVGMKFFMLMNMNSYVINDYLLNCCVLQLAAGKMRT